MKKRIIKEKRVYYYKTPDEADKKVKAATKLGFFVTMNPPTLFRNTYRVTVKYRLKLRY